MSGLKNVRSRRDDALSRIHWAKVERLLAAHYRVKGFQVEHTGTGATGARFDGGVDLKLRNDDEFILVQCKHWNAKQVPHNDVHQLIGLMVNHAATGAILVTSGEFTRYAIEAAAKQGHVQLIDGSQLREMLGPLPDEPAVDAVSPNTVRVAAVSSARPRPRRRGGSSAGPTSALGKLAVAVIGAAFIWIVVQVGVARLQRNLVSGHVVTPTATPQTSDRALSKVQPAYARELSEPANADGSVHASSDAELKEWQRKNAESMKLLEKSTPELH